MNVKELIAVLRTLSPTIPILIQQDSGYVGLDHATTMLNPKKETVLALYPTHFRRSNGDKNVQTKRAGDGR
jgi:hypothetical protein